MIFSRFRLYTAYMVLFIFSLYLFFKWSTEYDLSDNFVFVKCLPYEGEVNFFTKIDFTSIATIKIKKNYKIEIILLA